MKKTMQFRQHLLSILLLAAIPVVSVQAAAATTACPTPDQYLLIAPIGTLMGCMTLLQYLNGVFITAIGIAGILAVVMIVICGIRLMGTGSVSGKSEAKECIWNAIFGVLIAIGSWMLLNTINPLLLKNDTQISVVPADATTPPPSAPITEAQPTGEGCFFKYTQVDTGDVRYAGAGTGSMCGELRRDYQADKNTTVQTDCFCNQAGVAGTPKNTTAPPATSAGSVTCPSSGLNLCEGKYRQCTNPNCAQFAGMAAGNAVGSISAEMIKAVIMQESSCGTQLVGDNGQSCGPMHITPATANRFLDKCGLTDKPVTCGWLTDKVNFNKAICLSAQYLNSISQTQCGADVRNIAAGYNGGPGVCQASADCGGDRSCSGTTVQKWECLYDDTAHQICNGGYETTRNYATQVLYCSLNPGY